MVDVWRSVSTSTLLRAAEETLDSRANIYFPNLTYLNILIIVSQPNPSPGPGITTWR